MGNVQQQLDKQPSCSLFFEVTYVTTQASSYAELSQHWYFRVDLSLHFYGSFGTSNPNLKVEERKEGLVLVNQLPRKLLGRKFMDQITT